jgi:hypothetical protein
MGLQTPALHPENQRGQALVFSLITLTVVILVALVTFNVGQQVLAKMRLQNAADAAVYSAVQAQARDYNFSAYTNRAMVANQVAVAQVVGLTSWGRNFNKTYTSEFTWVPETLTALGGPLAEWLWDTPWNINSKIASGFQKAMDTTGKVLAPLLDGLIAALSNAQMIYHYGTALTMAQTLGIDLFPSAGSTCPNGGGFLGAIGLDPDFAGTGGVSDMLTLESRYNVMRMNDPEACLSAGGFLTASFGIFNWLRFTERKNPNIKAKDGVEADRFASVTLASLDEFSRDRSTKNGWYEGAPEVFYVTPNPFIIDPTRLIPYQNGALLMWLWHRGGTELKLTSDANSQGNYVKRTWSALDATGFTGAAIFWISILGIPIPIPIIIPTMPMGWGAAQAGAGLSSNSLGADNNFGTDVDAAYGGVYKGFNTAASAAIARGEGAGSSLGKIGDGGLRQYFDVKKVDSTPNNVAPALLIEVERRVSRVPDSNSYASGRFTMQAGKPDSKDSMRALAKAEAYFARPDNLRPDWAREDGKVEFGSLYNPYWQTRLAANTFVERYASMLFHLNGPL